MKELEDIYVEHHGGCSHPVIVRRVGGKPALFVEGQHIADLSEDSETQLLTWAVAFSVFCQKLNFNAVKNTATFLAVYIIRSDSCAKLPKDLQAVIAKLM